MPINLKLKLGCFLLLSTIATTSGSTYVNLVNQKLQLLIAKLQQKLESFKAHNHNFINTTIFTSWQTQFLENDHLQEAAAVAHAAANRPLTLRNNGVPSGTK